MEKKLYEGWIGSGKTNSIKKRVSELIKNNKSMLILDTKKEYEELFKNTNYEVTKLDITDLEKGFSYNPLLVASKLYKEGKIDYAIDKITSFGNLLFKTDDSIDPYWDNAAKSVYTGICLYLLENNRNLNLKEIIKVSISEYEEFCNYINKQDVLSTINMITSSVINAPVETKGGILSVLNQKLGYFAHRPKLLEYLCTMEKLEIKSNNQVILLTNLDQNSIFNIIIDNFINNTTNEMIDRKEEYIIVLDNFDTVYDKEMYTELFKSYLSDNIECIVGVRNNGFVKPIDEFDVYYHRGEEVRTPDGELIIDKILNNLREIDLNFDKIDKPVKFSNKALEQYSEKELEKIENYILKEKLLNKIDKKIEELEKEENNEN